jgi:hypothetical protein
MAESNQLYGIGRAFANPDIVQQAISRDQTYFSNTSGKYSRLFCLGHLPLKMKISCIIV